MNNEIKLNDIIGIIEEKLSAGGEVTINPKGNSMMPLIKPGRDSVVLRRAPERLKKYDVSLYRRSNGQFVLHRVVKVCGDSYTMCGDNQWIREENVKHEAVIAVVSRIVRKGRIIGAENAFYRIYSYFRVLFQSLNSFCHKLWRRIKLGG